LLYECDPFSPDPSEIARVTDYVVAYACKGNSTLTREKTNEATCTQVSPFAVMIQGTQKLLITN
jgi:hypothetical protein